MPQLNPSPWFMIFVYTWAIFLLLVVPILLSSATPNEPVMQSAPSSKTCPWAWPWH
uniref:ATP synthase F0 subunit 8 n=1 Tax=Coryphaenoides armatus TaxID=76798 RepID=UPI0028D718AC|nr:ATP synthase F0 subunit 8 [Coryphaenoides armatus]WMY89425.1 ATP synthase F0 subunit 8 [Coryphaenoides armatus]